MLHVRQQRVLLRLVEAMDLIDEQNRAHIAPPFLFRALDFLAQLTHAGQHGRERDETQSGPIGEQTRECGLARAGWAPEDHRGKLTTPLQDGRKRTLVAQQVCLSLEFLEAPWPHAVRQRCIGLRRGDGGFTRKQLHTAPV